MKIGHVVIPLDAGVYCEYEVLKWVGHCYIGKNKCRVYPPSLGRSFQAGGVNALEPPNQDRYYAPINHYKELDWPSENWGYINSERTITIRAIGVKLLEGLSNSDEELMQFEEESREWKRIFQDWLSVIAMGPTDFEGCISNVEWMSENVTQRLSYLEYELGKIYEPHHSITYWEWDHAFDHTKRYEEAPLERKILSLAIRDLFRTNNQNAIIHAAIATECALMHGLRVHLSNKLSSEDIKKKLDKNRMLGNLLKLAQNYDLCVPDNTKEALVNPRNAIIHTGAQITQDVAQEAVNVASIIVNRFVLFPECCEEPPSRTFFQRVDYDYEDLR